MMFEERVREFLQRMLLENQIGRGNRRIIVEDVRLEKGGQYGDQVVILFREMGRVHCRFGFRVEACEPPSIDNPDRQWEESKDPEGEAPQVSTDIIFANFQERIEAEGRSLPEDCNPDGTTWI